MNAIHWTTLCELNLPPRVDHESLATEHITTAVETLHLPATYVARIRIALVEAVSHVTRRHVPEQSALPLCIRVLSAGFNEPLARQNWGFFLIEKTGTDGDSNTETAPHMIEVYLYS